MQKTDGSTRLGKIVEATSLSEVARRLTGAGVPAAASNVLGWTNGVRPREAVRLALQKVYGIPTESWRTDDEQSLASSKG